MYPLFETLCIANGMVLHTDYHLRRIVISIKELGIKNPGINEKVLSSLASTVSPVGTFRCRFEYGENGYHSQTLEYTMPSVNTLKIVDGGSIDYKLKFTDRATLEKLFDLRQGCDDILIVKEGCVTDTSVANLILHDGKKWYTPDTPLLAGTARARWIHNGILTECRIRVKDLENFSSFSLINALRSCFTPVFSDIRNIIL